MSDDRFAELAGDISTSTKSLVMRRPIAHTVSRLVLGMSPGAFVRFGHGFGLAEEECSSVETHRREVKRRACGCGRTIRVPTPLKTEESPQNK